MAALLLLVVAGSVVLWMLAGCVVLSWIDQRISGRLLVWAERCPMGGTSTVILLWPAVAAAYWRDGMRRDG